MPSPASLHSTADEAAAWGCFMAPSHLQDFCQRWLAILCGQVACTEAAMLLLMQGADTTFSPAAIWPDPARDMKYLVPTAERALAQRQGVVSGPGGDCAPLADQPAHVGYPIELDGTLHGVVVLHIAAGPTDHLQRSLRLVHWASAWLVTHFCRQRSQ